MAGIYTRTGDGGDTGLFGGGRVPKNHPRVIAYGAVDELNAAVGMAVAAVQDAVLRIRLETLQHDLFALGSALATPPPADGSKAPTTPDLPMVRVAEMEDWIDQAEQVLSPLREFILPGGSAGAAALHMCRTVCRRAEREVVALAANQPVDADLVRYLNRLSDLFFSMAREENAGVGVPDVTWRKDGRS
jgi:cob(I)alamin adenosyltransferase